MTLYKTDDGAHNVQLSWSVIVAKDVPWYIIWCCHTRKIVHWTPMMPIGPNRHQSRNRPILNCLSFVSLDLILSRLVVVICSIFVWHAKNYFRRSEWMWFLICFKLWPLVQLPVLVPKSLLILGSDRFPRILITWIKSARFPNLPSFDIANFLILIS